MQKIGPFTSAQIVPFFVGLMIALGLFYVFQNPNLFQANVLSLQDKETLIEYDWDVWYKVDDLFLDVYLSKDIDTFVEIKFEILFDQSVVFDFSQLEHQWDWEIVASGSWLYDIQMYWLSGMDFGQSLFVLPYSWSSFDVLLGEAYLQRGLDEYVALNVGSLTQKKMKHRK